MDMAQTIALSAGLAWASGLRLYLVVFLAGVLAHFGYLQLPSTLAVLQHPLVIGIAGVMAFAELVADKVPAFDSVWDGFQTFIRIPAGALLAAFLTILIAGWWYQRNVTCLLYTSPSPRDRTRSRMPSSA